jgi:tRNA threonylcarbamoyladenosine biosynthesis protein TsaB
LGIDHWSLPIAFFCALARPAPPAFRGGVVPSLTQLLAAHPVVLLLDSASARVQAALWPGTGAAPLWRARDEEAGNGLFACAEELLAAGGRTIADVNAFVFCEGPGSVLGVRSAAMALRVWRVLNPAARLFAYQSLSLVSHALGDPAASVIADARRGSWHVARPGAPLRRLATAELAGDLVMPEHFRHWTPLPAQVRRTPYDLAALFPRAADVDLFHATDAPDAFLHEEPAYATWTPQVHQRPEAGSQKSEVRGQKSATGGQRAETGEMPERASASNAPTGATP